jgi:aspartate/methionine/tyrosine aminotransferase
MGGPPTAPLAAFRYDAAVRLPDFRLERYFARWEFRASYLLCSSDIEGYRLDELLALADEQGRGLWRDLRLGYTESPGHPQLRREIARLYERVEPEHVLVFSGAEEAIFALANVLLGPQDHAVVTWPAYQSLHEVARSTGAAVDLWPLRRSDWGIDPADLRKLIRPATKLVVVNFPHNPTGALPEPAAFRAIASAAEQGACRLLSDEAYRLLEYNPPTRLPAAADLSERAVSLGVMSKAFALAGLRIGWIATRDEELLARLSAFKDYTTICASAPSEILAIIALRARDRILARNRTIIADNLARLDRFFSDWPHAFTWIRPRAGSVGFPRILGGTSADAFCEELREREGVLLLPGSVFDYTGEHFRIGFGRTNLPEALGRMERFVARRVGRPAGA